MTIEAVYSGKAMLMVARRRVQPIGGLSQAQLEWCRQNLKGFAWPRVQRLAVTEPQLSLTLTEDK
jgi:hypothetical protein